MAGAAFQLGVLAFEAEASGIVVEGAGLPTLRRVTALTIRTAIFFKLAVVDVVVTARTLLRDVSKLYLDRSLGLIRAMTIATAHLAVFAL